MELDHIVIAVADLVDAGREFETRYGLASIEGGRHPDWGTANRIVPLGDAYLELVAIVDVPRARGSAFGRWVASARPKRMSLLGWAARTDDLDDVARRLGLEIGRGSRTASDGRQLRWRIAGVEQAAAEPFLPFFIEWAPGTPLPGHPPVAHSAGTIHLAGIDLEGDPDRLTVWLASPPAQARIRLGRPAVTAVRLAGRERFLIREDEIR